MDEYSNWGGQRKESNTPDSSRRFLAADPSGRAGRPGKYGARILERFNKSHGLDGTSAGSFREVLDCGSPLPLWRASAAVKKRQRAAAVQDAGTRFDCRSLFGGYGFFKTF
jgi:hypothetical protein